MNLRIFFDSLGNELADKAFDTGDLRNFIKLHHEEFPDWTTADLAIVGLPDDHGHEVPDAVREKLFRLKPGAGYWKIADLGNLREGSNKEETFSRVREVVSLLLSQNVLPVLIGRNHSYDIPQFEGHEEDGPLNMVAIDAFLDLYQDGTTDRSHLYKIFSKKNHLFHYGHIAHQSFLVEQEHLNTLEKLHYDLLRVGKVKETPEEAEPVLRNADIVSFDISAIRSSDAPGSDNPQPFGLTGEEACRLTWYAGVSPGVKSFGLYGYQPAGDKEKHTAAVAATMIWYFAEGFYHRKPFIKKNDSGMQMFRIPLQEYPHELIFYKETTAERWWMEVPSKNSENNGNILIPCSYNDYREANEGDIPSRWIAASARFRP